MRKILPSFAWMIMLVLLVIALSWLLRNGIPNPSPVSSSEPMPTHTSFAPVPIIATSTAQATPQLLPTPTPDNINVQVALLPQVTFRLPESLPYSPDQLTLYRQIVPESVNLTNAQQIAQILQIQNAEPVQQPQSNETGYSPSLMRLSNGWQELTFQNFYNHFTYVRAPQLTANATPLTEQQQIERAAAYLEQLGLLNQPYRAQAAQTNGFGVRFIPLLNNLPVYFSIGTQDEDWLSIFFDQAGNINSMSARLRDFTPIGEYPLLSAAQAWQRLNAPNGLEHARYAVLSPKVGEPARVWLPTYEPGVPVDLYGYLSVNNPEDGSHSQVVTINNWVIANPPAELLALYAPNANAPIVHLQGMFTMNNGDYTQFNVQNWDMLPASASMRFVRGYLQRTQEPIFIADNGETLRLPYLPAAIPDGARLEISGLPDPKQPDILHWHYLASGDYGYTYQQSQTCFGGGGGGGGNEDKALPADFGGGSLANFNPQGSANVVTHQEPNAMTAAIGTSINGVRAKVYVQRFVNTLGQPQLHYSAWIEPDEIFENGAALTLGGNLQGLDTYVNLPVNLWGVIKEPDPSLLPSGMPADVYLWVERYEPLYPNARLAEFAGTLARVTLDSGTTVVVLNTAENTPYLLETSLLYGADEAFVGRPGDLVEIEGYLTGDIFENYPILSVVSAGTSPDGIVSSAQIYDWTPPFNDFESPAQIQGVITIEEVELAYSGVYLDGCLPNSDVHAEDLADWLVLQPIWVFRGTFDDGRLFVVQVQALPDAFLK
ncbi:MAG: hypothetical protein OHK0052_23710 [Anaerolineales bacterium]